MISVVIPCRNESLTGHTISSVLRTAELPVEVILVEDECRGHQDLPRDRRIRILEKSPAEGVDRARHAGIEAAGYPVILTLDAHMTCEPGWDRIIAGHLAQHPDGVCCCQCPALAADLTMTPGDTGYLGARIEFMHHDMQYFGWSLFQPKWTDGASTAIRAGRPARIGCVLGASYAFLRERYTAIGSPWESLWGWGWSEPLLSLANWCMGGESWVLPCRIGHFFRTGRFDQVPYTTQIPRIIHNQMLLADALPMSPPLRRDLFTHLYTGWDRCFYARDCYEAAGQMRRDTTGDTLGRRLETAPRTLDEYRSAWP